MNIVRASASGRARVAAASLNALTRLARRFLQQLHVDGAELDLALVGDSEIRTLNRQFRGKDMATDVLSFPSGHQPPGPKTTHLGQVVISVGTARRMAARLGTTLASELALYLAHGILHLLGFDHHSAGEAEQMGRLEASLVRQPGMLERSGSVRSRHHRIVS